jgi:hypothetical protein
LRRPATAPERATTSGLLRFSGAARDCPGLLSGRSSLCASFRFLKAGRVTQRCSAGRCRRIELRPRGRQLGEDGPDEDDGVGLVMSETTEIGRHPVAGNLQLLVCEMNGVHASSVERRPAVKHDRSAAPSHCVIPASGMPAPAGVSPRLIDERATPSWAARSSGCGERMASVPSAALNQVDATLGT